MTDGAVEVAYTRRAAEYTELFGSTGKAHELDQLLISRWAQSLRGPAIDAGCGPGHWTALLGNLGVVAEGVDLVPLFIEQAQSRFPDVQFRVATLRDLGVPDGHLAGILAWYSLIHFSPAGLPFVFYEFSRCISPGGGVLVGFFEGSPGEPFAHAVTTAYSWSIEAMSLQLAAAGFDVQEAHGRRVPGVRPHAALLAVRSTREVLPPLAN